MCGHSPTEDLHEVPYAGPTASGGPHPVTNPDTAAAIVHDPIARRAHPGERIEGGKQHDETCGRAHQSTSVVNRYGRRRTQGNAAWIATREVEPSGARTSRTVVSSASWSPTTALCALDDAIRLSTSSFLSRAACFLTRAAALYYLCSPLLCSAAN